ncbi:S-methyl-5'-thioinosine phosphorylase [Zhongshania aliphaticivorans]|uniref:S-methyl-5'-thioinosine phosphorylase n=1 Tax=Zhongshania aliphaticivorans TaxID=1470434 RepID=UPI0012E6AFD2|nr:S-methyl-5'-thioinosine phosphorylase [Zhongshania aliphaticivorans]CAA0108363.1 S-methyl-5'-thioinosine phosphorylase [Zhongshania aliphaticivorans]
MSKTIAVIGGTGLCDWPGAEVLDETVVETPYGAPSAHLQRIRYEGAEFLFLARHGKGHQIPPHAINYRANIDALKKAGVGALVAVNAVGGISERFVTGVIAIPNQINDYTWGREHTFFDGSNGKVEHIDFSYPYSQDLRSRLANAAVDADIAFEDYGVYAVTQGPRLETASEISRLARDGNDIVGMTAMPEASLAREAGIEYASIALVVNPGAGLSDNIITMEDIQTVIDTGMLQVKSILAQCIAAY